MKDPRLDNLPFILETPTVDDTLKLADLPTSQANEDGNGAIWRREISLLHALERDDDDGAERLLGEIRALVKKGKEVSDGKKAAKKERKMSKGKGNGKVKMGGVEDEDDLDQTEEESSDAGKTDEDEGDKQEKPKGRRTPDRARGRRLPGKTVKVELSDLDEVTDPKPMRDRKNRRKTVTPSNAVKRHATEPAPEHGKGTRAKRARTKPFLISEGGDGDLLPEVQEENHTVNGRIKKKVKKTKHGVTVTI